jgi:hypothetical protein
MGGLRFSIRAGIFAAIVFLFVVLGRLTGIFVYTNFYWHSIGKEIIIRQVFETLGLLSGLLVGIVVFRSTRCESPPQGLGLSQAAEPDQNID